MKKLVIFYILFSFLSCDKKEKIELKPTFLVGNWKRLNDKPGSQTFETWNADLKGFGYTKKGEETIFSEQMEILKIKDTLHLKVSGVNEKPPYFKFTNQTDTSFVCVNPQNEFPKKIKYYLDNNQLKAEISSDDFRIDFIFERSKN